MSFVAAAVVGGTVVSGYLSNKGSKRSAQAVERGTEASIAAQLESTKLQIGEIQRQFDYQQRVLRPMVEQQYRAQGTYGDLLGMPAPGPQGGSGFQESARPLDVQNQRRQEEIDIYQAILDDPTASPSARQKAQEAIDVVNARPYDAERIEQEQAARGPQAAPPGSYGLDDRFRGDQGQFVDPNLDPTKLADVNTLGDQVRGNLLAGTGAEDDPYRNYIADNRIAAATADEDARFARARDVTLAGERGGVTLAGERGDVSLAEQRGDVSLAAQRGDISLAEQRGGERLAEGAAGTGVYGDVFKESPGYAFQREEMERQLERANSRGGNFGGRAIMEAQRRAQGLAAGDYYNWAAGRERDLSRLGGAEAADMQRGDYFAQHDIQRGDDFARTDIARGDEFARTDIARGDLFSQYDIGRGDDFARTDIARGDEALAGYESQRIADVQRGDEAYQNYLSRRAGDASRLDAAAQQEDQLQAADLQRSDQAYYNYLNNLARSAGFGNSAAQAVQSSQAAGGAVAGAYAQQGAQNSAAYQNLGNNLANIQQNKYQGINNAVQGGIGNYFFAQGAGLFGNNPGGGTPGGGGVPSNVLAPQGYRPSGYGTYTGSGTWLT